MDGAVQMYVLFKSKERVTTFKNAALCWETVTRLIDDVCTTRCVVAEYALQYINRLGSSFESHITTEETVFLCCMIGAKMDNASHKQPVVCMDVCGIQQRLPHSGRKRIWYEQWEVKIIQALQWKLAGSTLYDCIGIVFAGVTNMHSVESHSRLQETAYKLYFAVYAYPHLFHRVLPSELACVFYSAARVQHRLIPWSRRLEKQFGYSSDNIKSSVWTLLNAWML